MQGPKTIRQLQSEIETALERISEFADQLPDVLKPLLSLAPPEGVCAQVSLRHAASERQVQRNAPAGTWSPESGSAVISYDTSEGAAAVPGDVTSLPSAREEDPGRDLVLSLAKVEQDPQLGFVSLKWFRDTFLPRQGYAWAVAADDCQRVLVDAINRRWILTSKHPNPKNPQYPVTAIRLNRSMTEVRKIVDQEAGFGSTFEPITISGESLSDTVLRDRR